MVKYDESSITILEGLEAVRKRPGMYIGSTDKRGLHHLVWEIIDNSVDEIINGYGNKITVRINKDGSITIADNGRGVPTGMHKSGKSTPEVIYTILHAGGKFETNGYKVSGGLHGVGASVVNALSDWMEVTILRDGAIHQIKFKEGGKVDVPLKKIGTTNKTGTIVTFKPNAEIFKNLGADEIVSGGQTMNPSTEDILNAVEKVNAENVFILPNNKNIILASEQAAKIVEDKKIFVVPSTSVPEGISALINYDASQSVEDSFEAMKENISLVKTCMVTYAVRDTAIGETKIAEGDILGMLGGKIEVVSKDIEEGTCQLLEKAIDDDSEMVTIYYGADMDNAAAEKISAFIGEKYPDCEVEIVNGGQPLYYYIISVE